MVGIIFYLIHLLKDLKRMVKKKIFVQYQLLAKKNEEKLFF
jgi:hypothetical protein